METMIDCDRARALVLDVAQPMAPRRMPPADALDHALAESIAADRDYPPFNRAQMDGYAVRLADAGRAPRVMGELAAGATWTHGALADGCAIEIMTGAPCPEGCEAVVPYEDAKREGECVRLPAEVTAGQNIQPRGREAQAGQVILQPGMRLTPLVLGVLANIGVPEVLVRPRPRMAIIVTGNEIEAATPSAALHGARIRDANGPMLAAMCRKLGISEVVSSRAEDTLDSLREALERALRDEPEIVILTGGVSMGKHDLVPRALRDAGATPVFHKVSQRPGKPLLFATAGDRLFFGLPGNPLSCCFCFHRYIAPAIRRLSGLDPEPRMLRGRLAAPMQVQGSRVVFQWVRVEASTSGPIIHPLPGRSSADLFAAAAADGLWRIDPPGPSSEAAIAAGDEVTIELL